jgi:hypothetical protein
MPRLFYDPVLRMCALLHEPVPEGHASVPNPHHVHIHHPARVALFDGQGLGHLGEDTGVVGDDVDVPEALPRSGGQGLDRVAIGHITLHPDALDAHRRQLRGDHLGRGGVDVGHHDVTAVGRQGAGDARPDAATCSGDDGDLVGQ